MIFLLLAGLVVSLNACSTLPKIKEGDKQPPFFDAKRLLKEDSQYAAKQIYDPWEGFNRTIYRFNYRADRYLLLPVVTGYQYVTPEIVQKGIHNFFTNIYEIPTLYNSVLQLSGKKSIQSTGRLIANTTVGLAGILDAATYMGIPKHQEDFGQTLGYWGTGGGPYMVLPFFGPSTLRDGCGIGVDSAVMSLLRSQLDLRLVEELGIEAVRTIDTRAHISFRYFETGSPFEYEIIRQLWLVKRQMDIEK